MKHFFRSFRYALRGVAYAFRREHNFQVEVVFSIIVFVLAVCFQLSPIERSILFAMMGGVLALELINTAVERLVDMTRPRVHPYAKVVKDIMAGAVLVMALFSVLIGFVIFFPRIAALFH
jgi:undecaprenol kinase